MSFAAAWKIKHTKGNQMFPSQSTWQEITLPFRGYGLCGNGHKMMFRFGHSIMCLKQTQSPSSSANVTRLNQHFQYIYLWVIWHLAPQWLQLETNKTQTCSMIFRLNGHLVLVNSNPGNPGYILYVYSTHPHFKNEIVSQNNIQYQRLGHVL